MAARDSFPLRKCCDYADLLVSVESKARFCMAWAILAVGNFSGLRGGRSTPLWYLRNRRTMNAKMKKRMIAVSGVIVLSLIHI